MSGLGNIQSVGHAMRANVTTGGRKTNGKQTAGNSESASSKARSSKEIKLSAREKSIAAAEIAENIAERVISTVDEREKYLHAIDLSFGVEKLSYKNMWKVLKTVVKEIGVIKEANTGRFALGVSQRLDNAKTLMEFGSLKDFLHEKTDHMNEDTWKESGTSLAHGIASDPDAAERAQANISPHRAMAFLI